MLRVEERRDSLPLVSMPTRNGALCFVHAESVGPSHALCTHWFHAWCPNQNQNLFGCNALTVNSPWVRTGLSACLPSFPFDTQTLKHHLVESMHGLVPLLHLSSFRFNNDKTWTKEAPRRLCDQVWTD
jgi:hypothetical protein